MEGLTSKPSCGAIQAKTPQPYNGEKVSLQDCMPASPFDLRLANQVESAYNNCLTLADRICELSHTTGYREIGERVIARIGSMEAELKDETVGLYGLNSTMARLVFFTRQFQWLNDQFLQINRTLSEVSVSVLEEVRNMSDSVQKSRG